MDWRSKENSSVFREKIARALNRSEKHLYTKGTAKQAAEKLTSLKGTAYRPYITAV
jgi:hypothetical protein